MLKQEEIELAKTRAMVQSIIKKDAGPDAWKDYYQVVYPWIETAQKQEKEQWIARLNEEVKQGPLAVIARHDAPFRSRLKARTIPREEVSDVRDPEALKRLSQRLRPSVFRGR